MVMQCKSLGLPCSAADMLSGMLQQAIIVMGENGGQQSAGIQYCTSIRTELGERKKVRKS